LGYAIFNPHIKRPVGYEIRRQNKRIAWGDEQQAGGEESTGVKV
jgi:hypothetical protein